MTQFIVSLNSYSLSAYPLRHGAQQQMRVRNPCLQGADIPYSPRPHSHTPSPEHTQTHASFVSFLLTSEVSAPCLVLRQILPAPPSFPLNLPAPNNCPHQAGFFLIAPVLILVSPTTMLTPQAQDNAHFSPTIPSALSTLPGT